MNRGRLPLAYTPVAREVFRAMFDWEWRAYLRDRCAVQRWVAVRIGQDVRG